MNPILATKIVGKEGGLSIQTLMSGNDDPSSIDPLLSQSIYIHIPFCSKKCPYCHFYVVRDTFDMKSQSQKEMLLQALIQELHLVKTSFSQEKKLVSIYWGGGTPSLFGPERINTFHEEIKKLFPHQLASNIEVTLEANPDLLTENLIQEYKESGINRLSLGAQSFHQSELSLLGRSHTAATVFQVLEWAHKVGLCNISLDLMYDLPDQSYKSWQQNLKTAFCLPITHLSLYNLTIEPGTPFFKIQKTLEKKRPSDEVSRDMYIIAQEMAIQHGFHQYEISAFAKQGFFSRHNTGYWNGRDFYGFGPSAYSFMNNIRFSNAANLNRYIHNIESQKIEYEEIDIVSSEERIRELFCIGLRLFSGVSLDSLLRKYQALLPATFYTKLSDLIEAHLISKFYHHPTNSERYTLTQKGALLHNAIAAEFI